MLIIFVAVILVLIAILLLALVLIPPKEEASDLSLVTPEKTSETSWRIRKSWFRKSKSGLWELYVEGKPYERGLVIGKLTRDLIFRQEKIFIEEVKKMVPSRIYLNFLKIFVALMNRRLSRHIGDEYCREIHGVSEAAPKEFSSIGPKYQRMLNYHAAHDIGHTLQSMNLVGCTAFSAWGARTAGGDILTGRNFDFYMGDEFSREKIVCFYAPEQGYRFAAITWGGMIGSVSGMNEHGLAVTINGAKSEFPNRSATPISIMVREILQYARNISDAYKIAEKKRIFVSESLVISSAEDMCTAIIEKSKTKTILFKPEGNEIICTNHFQSEELFSDKSNQQYMSESPSEYRYLRVAELMSKSEKLDVKCMAAILRDKKGNKDVDMGLGNEKAVDQLLAHHSVIFNTMQRILWVSCGPYQEGAYQAYDLKKNFASGSATDEKCEIVDPKLEIPADSFLDSDDHKRFLKYKEMLHMFINKKNRAKDLTSLENDFIASNPEMFMVYSALGDHCMSKKQYSKAIGFFQTGLTKHIPNKHEADYIRKKLDKAMKKNK